MIAPLVIEAPVPPVIGPKVIVALLAWTGGSATVVPVEVSGWRA